MADPTPEKPGGAIEMTTRNIRRVTTERTRGLIYWRTTESAGNSAGQHSGHAQQPRLVCGRRARSA
jgi:hypothetical protein